jgi:hypothetical protein
MENPAERRMHFVSRVDLVAQQDYQRIAEGAEVT